MAAARPGSPAGVSRRWLLEELQRAYVDLRFGMFIHFGILTYTGAWAQPNLPITMFNPTGPQPRSVGRRRRRGENELGVLTTRHHDGFALWPAPSGTST